MYLLFKYEYLKWLDEMVLPHYIQPRNKKLLGIFNNLEDAQKGVPEELLYGWSACRVGQKIQTRIKLYCSVVIHLI